MSRLFSSTLFIATKLDSASINIASNLIRRFAWKEVSIPTHITGKNRVFCCPQFGSPASLTENETIRTQTTLLYMWLVDEPLLTLNYANEKFLSLWHTESSAGQSHSNPQYLPNKISDIIFLSKHAAASGTLSLTVHPVGIPWVLSEDEENFKKSGGIPGKCSPPSVHIGSLYRAIIDETKSRGLDSMFQVTLEATHHGPYVSVPACFVEIGSTETEWINGEAGRNWSECLGDYFHLMRRNEHEILEDSFDINVDPIEEYDVVTTFMESTNMISFEDPEKGLVVITIGTGHYVPKMNDMARYGEDVYVGHALATYALQDHWNTVHGDMPKWKQIIQEAVSATRITHPMRKVMCYVDKKSFVADQRDKITNFLEELEICWTFKASDIKSLVGSLK